MIELSDAAIALLFNNIPLTGSGNYEKTEENPVQNTDQNQTINTFESVYMLFPEAFLPSQNKDIHLFYKNILKAINRSEQSVEIISEQDFKEEMTKANSLFICWGTQFANQENKYNVFNTKHGGLCIWIDKIELISNDKNLKSQLWQKLKPLFNV